MFLTPNRFPLGSQRHEGQVDDPALGYDYHPYLYVQGAKSERIRRVGLGRWNEIGEG